LSSLLARDHFVPRQFATLGERLVFSNGIVVLAGFAALLLVVFRGETHALIPLYAVGVFISFTLSQSGMVVHWWRDRQPGWRHRIVINGVGALAPTATVRGVFVETDPARTRRLEQKWARWGMGVPLVVLTSPYRSLLRPLIDYIDQIQARGDNQMVTIVLPEFLPRRWWQHILHNQTALLVKGALLFRRNLVVADVPYLLKR